MDYSTSLGLENIVFFSDYDKVWRTEEFKDIPGYEGIYQVSDLGRVKSFDRVDRLGRLFKGKVLKPTKGVLYYTVCLCINNIKKSFQVHQLVAIAFLDHTPCGYKLVVDHINNDNPSNKLDNRVCNLRIVTQRVNANQKHITSSSIYTGVSWCKTHNKWVSSIWIGKKKKTLGRFVNEYDAHLTYQTALNNLNK